MNRLLLAAIVAAVAASAALIVLHGRGGVVHVRVSTTTSLYATGLLDYLAKRFESTHPGVRIDFIAVGSGAALRMAADGEACMVFVHAPSLEKKYIEEGVLTGHKIIAYNYFVIVGPPSDPAHVRSAKNAAEAFKRIYEAGEEGKARFVSRGDMSGTNVKELSLWRLAGINPGELKGRKWYIVSGQGMAQTLVMADQLGAYTLSDIGTYLKLKKEGRLPHLTVLYSNSTELINIYSIYLVRGCSGAEARAAREFYDWVYSHRSLIGSYGVKEYGRPLFYSSVGKEKQLMEIWEKLAQG